MTINELLQEHYSKNWLTRYRRVAQSLGFELNQEVTVEVCAVLALYVKKLVSFTKGLLTNVTAERLRISQRTSSDRRCREIDTSGDRQTTNETLRLEYSRGLGTDSASNGNVQSSGIVDQKSTIRDSEQQGTTTVISPNNLTGNETQSRAEGTLQLFRDSLRQARESRDEIIGASNEIIGAVRQFSSDFRQASRFLGTEPSNSTPVQQLEPTTIDVVVVTDEEPF